MTGTEVRLILDTRPVPRGPLSSAQPAQPNVAVVYATGFGEVASFDGRPLRRGQQLMSKYRFRYDVDLSDHRRTARLERTPLPSREDAYRFDAEVDVGFRVSDPEAIVRRNVGDALPIVYGHLAAQFRLVTRKYDIRRAEDAELEINSWFARPAVLEEGITIYYCSVRLSPDNAARIYLQQLEEVQRATSVGAARHGQDVGAAQHEHIMALMAEQSRQELDQLAARTQPELEAREIAKAEHEARLAHIAAAARRDEDRLEREALANLPQDLWSVLILHLQRHPDETAYVTDLYARHMDALAARQDINDQRSLELVRYMMDRDLIQPVDMGQLRDQTLKRVQQIAGPAGGGDAALPSAGEGWDDQLPDGVSQVIRGSSVPGPPPGSPPSAGRAVPVYVLVDESVELPGYLDAVNEGLAGLPAALARNPDTVGAIRLALLGYAAEVAVRIPLTGVSGAGTVPALTPRGGCRLAPALTDLRERLTADIDRCKSHDLVVGRPVVVVLSAAAPHDPQDWPAAHHALTDRATFRYAPTIVACGLGGADPATVARLATQPGQAFQAAAGMPVEYSVRSFTDFLARFVAHWAAESLTGAGRAVLDRPAGFVPAVAPPQEPRAPHESPNQY
ncbi:uncharacterized protein YegL [Catenulispora sp. GP43]|uniref:hypothetical protein n=1 Tax=Catenulispora sp. GP43 TaxID=3156263 RepID=UPI00351604CB